MEDIVLGELVFDRYVWYRSMGKSMYGSGISMELLVQDENQEGILDVQRIAYQTYMENEERYIKEIPRYLLDYYKWNFEEINSVVKLGTDEHKDVISEETLVKMCNVYYLFICRDGNFGWVLGSFWCKEGFAVLLSESEPRVLTMREELRFLHKTNDSSFGLLVHNGANSWKGLKQHRFFGEVENLVIELEGSVEEGITEVQKKAFDEYLEREEEYFKKLTATMLAAYLGDERKAAAMLFGGVQMIVKTVPPKTLYIDKEGNYGWICHTQWDGGYIGVLLSDGEVYVMKEADLKEYRKKEKVKDEVMGLLFVDATMYEKLIIVRLADEMRTLPLRVSRINGTDINDKVYSAYKKYLELNTTLWEEIKDLTLNYYLANYDEFIEHVENKEDLRKGRANREYIVSELLRFKSLYITSPDGFVAWLCERLTDSKELAFEFTDGKIKLVPQTELIEVIEKKRNIH